MGSRRSFVSALMSSMAFATLAAGVENVEAAAQTPRTRRRILVFDVNETMLDINALEPPNLLVLGAPGRIRSYIVSGVGLVRLRVSLNHTSVDSNVTGYDAGGGVNDFVTTHVGIRGDVRYVHTFQDVTVRFVSGKLGFWRASLGLALKL